MKSSGSKFTFKITVIGNGRVGKTSLIQKFTQGSFQEDYIKTIGAQFSIYDKEIEGDKIRLLFWDIAGQDEFNFARPSFFKNSKMAIIVYSLEDNDLGVESFNHISNWHEDIIKFCGNIPVVLFANKVDLVDENNLDHSRNEGVVNKLKLLGNYITSAKTGQGVIEAFNFIVDKLYQDNKKLSAEL
ncbi:MAG: GTP-binding protein [Candidatus Lokiarchaeota archaeon]|nr:GTP-binding protein [Candidatus Lokiarchaeota archaeon]